MEPSHNQIELCHFTHRGHSTNTMPTLETEKDNLIQTFIDGKIKLSFKMAKFFPRSSKKRKSVRNEILGNIEKDSPLPLEDMTFLKHMLSKIQ